MQAMYSLYLFVLASLCASCQEQGPETFSWPEQGVQAAYAFKLPSPVDECSGAISWTDSTFITHNDDGPPELYEVSYTGRLVSTLPIPGAINTDWEDLTHNGAGTIYISDLGNNRNTRTDLCIYRYTLGTPSAQKIEISYANQHDFPPAEIDKNFDSEAIFYWENNLYIISKNRGHKWVRLYKVPTTPGSYSVSPIDSIKLFEPVTGAAVSPTKKTLAVLGYGKIYFFNLKPGQPIFAHPIDSLRFAKSGQAEAIWWQDATHFYVGNEAQRVFAFEKNK